VSDYRAVSPHIGGKVTNWGGGVANTQLYGSAILGSSSSGGAQWRENDVTIASFQVLL
jgi:hypothetical protein